MTKRLLIDAAHAEETRVIITDGTRIEEFETETQGKAQLKGNIYIAHVSRVEPSLQAAFITYGGNRNGFLAFAEVNPMFFNLPKAEKAELMESLAAAAQRRRGQDDAHDDMETTETKAAEATPVEAEETEEAAAEIMESKQPAELMENAGLEETEVNGNVAEGAEKPRRGRRPQKGPKLETTRARPRRAGAQDAEGAESAPQAAPAESAEDAPRGRGRRDRNERGERGQRPERGNRERDRDEPRAATINPHRKYRIQDVLKEGQKILVQVVKEERGSKGAALTTFFSLAGRYTVLMPNTPSAGGISRKITDPEERRALRDAYAALDVPPTMGLIIRTAGVSQPIDVIQNDYANLTKLWKEISQSFEKEDDIQCVHEDGSVIVRALRDMAVDDLDEIVISGKRAYKMAKDYCKNLMPEAAKLIKEHKEDTPLFTHYKLENKLHQLHHTRVQLPSGGYLVINPTEALVSVDINSGRATQERNIEETATKTNLEACEELARQIRLRDLAGLIVVDFIDMEDNRNIRKVENAMRKALRRDRARIQCGNISQFGLMEISRQRLRPSFAESHFIPCPQCNGSGHVHAPGTAGLMILRRLEEDDCAGADRIVVTTGTQQVLWMLNHKRDLIRDLEAKHKFQLVFRADDSLHAPDHRLELIHMKADGTESNTVLNVTLREQPELPPEQRYTPSGRRRDEAPRERDERSDRRRDDREDRPRPSHERNREERSADRREDKREDKRPHDRNDKRQDRPGRPQRAEADTAAEAKPARAERPQPKHEMKKDGPTRPARPTVEAHDAPLAVQKVAVSDDDTPVIKAAKRAPMVIKKQADTDALNAPLAVVKQSEAESKQPVKKAAPKKDEPKAEDAKPAKRPARSDKPEGEAEPKAAPKPGSILARLIGRP